MAMTPAEKQKRYRDRLKLSQANGALPDAPAEVLPSRARPAKTAAIEKLVDAGTAARAAQPVTEQLWAAFEAGLAARIFCEIAQGMTGAEELLVSWLDSEPAGLWLFHQFLAEQGLYGEFQSWSSSSPSGRSVV